MTDQVLGPKVSVIMAAFNASSFVDEALESIAAQTYENWELIVCDDASTDETYEMLKAFEAKHPTRVRVIRNAVNSKLSYWAAPFIRSVRFVSRRF